MAKDNVVNGLSHNIIANGTKVVGTITTSNDIKIDGSVEGDLICKGKVVIGAQGAFNGNIECQNAEIFGTVDGKMQISELLSLKSTAKIVGQIKTKTLCIEPNAIFTGSCDMGTGAVNPVAVKK